MKQLVIGLPSGSLQQATLDIFSRAGFKIRLTHRSYVPDIDDPSLSLRFLRAQEISRYVELGMLDAGITGYDWITENQSDVIEVAELVYAKHGLKPVRWVVAVPEKSDIRCLSDLNGRRIATEAVGLTAQFLKRNKIKADVEFSWGTTEVKAPELVDAIVELTETGSSLRANGLRELETVLESTTRLIANKSAWKNEWKKTKMEHLSMLLQGALDAEFKVLLKMNAPSGKVAKIISILPSLHAPTVSGLNDKGWVAIESVVDESVVREILPKLKTAGADGIIELPINKIIP